HSVAVSLARIIAATRDIIHYTARFVNTFFQKNSDFFRAASGSTYGAEERCHSTRKSAAFRDRRLNVCPSYPGGGRQ
ncbi:MAG: hypothetical protein SOT57_02815, partial [Eubacteriales bacterium]|nr:hypothetical protein [Eubacteriales bacterium]